MFYSMKMLDAMLQQNIRFIDYEAIRARSPSGRCTRFATRHARMHSTGTHAALQCRGPSCRFRPPCWGRRCANFIYDTTKFGRFPLKLQTRHVQHTPRHWRASAVSRCCSSTRCINLYSPSCKSFIRHFVTYSAYCFPNSTSRLLHPLPQRSFLFHGAVSFKGQRHRA